jgi:hypothetical protein
VSIVPASAAERATGIRYRPLPSTVPHLRTAMVRRQDAHVHVIERFIEVSEREALKLKGSWWIVRDVDAAHDVVPVAP